MEYIRKTIIIVVNSKSIIDLLNYAEDDEIIEIHRMTIISITGNASMVSFDMSIESELYEDFMIALNKETRAFELIKD